MINNRMDKIIFAGLLIVIAFTALAHGAVEPWSVAIFELLTLLLMLLWAVKSVIDKRFELKLSVTIFPLAAFLILGLIQSISITNESGQLTSLSLDTEATRSAVKILFFLLCSYLMAINFFKTQSSQQKLVVFLTVFGFSLSIFGLIQYFTWNGNLYWIRPAAIATKGVIGPFVNHNHFAGYIELIIPIPIALLVTGAVRHNRILYGFAAIMMAVALVASLSRGGIISLVSGLLFVTIAGLNYIRRKTRAAHSRAIHSTDFPADSIWGSVINLGAVALIIGAIIVGVLWIGSSPVIDRLTKNNVVSTDEKAESLERSRGWIWENSMTMFRLNELTGVGMGAFETAYPKYSTDNLSLSQTVDRAHNDYIQVLTDTGVIGGVIALSFILALIFTVIRSFRSRDPFRAGLAMGCGGAIFSMMVHSIFDFNLQIPSTALLFLVITAVSVNLSAPSKELR